MDTNSFIDSKVKAVLGAKFNYIITGVGRNQVLELEVPEEMASPESRQTYTAMTEDEQVNQYKKILAERGESYANVWKEKMEKMADGRLRYPANHPRAGEIRGDVRHLVIGNLPEEEIVGWLQLIKNKITKEFANKQMAPPLFV